MTRTSSKCFNVLIAFLVTAFPALSAENKLDCVSSSDDNALNNYFAYDPNSKYGPKCWDGINIDQSEFFDYFDDYENQCGGEKQSPINVNPNSVCTDDHKTFNRRGNHNFDEIDFAVLPHSLRANLPGDNVTGAQADFSNLASWSPAVFVDVKLPAEHHLFGVPYAGEFQIYHHCKCGRGRFIIISILMDARPNQHNDMLETFIREWEEAGRKRRHDCNNIVINSTNPYTRTHSKLTTKELRSIFTKGSKADWDLYDFRTTPWHCGYSGSLTIPPCTERAYWRILDLPMNISQSQKQRMQNLLAAPLDQECQRITTPFRRKVSRPLQQNIENVWCCTQENYDSNSDRWSFPPEYHGFHNNTDMTPDDNSTDATPWY